MSGHWEEDEEVCGETYDHDLDVVFEDETGRTLWCRLCGAEIVEETPASEENPDILERLVNALGATNYDDLLEDAATEIRQLRVGDEIARRHADGWHPEFASDPKDHRWVPRNDDEEPEPLTAEQYEWYQAAWAERHARKAAQ